MVAGRRPRLAQVLHQGEVVARRQHLSRDHVERLALVHRLEHLGHGHEVADRVVHLLRPLQKVAVDHLHRRHGRLHRLLILLEVGRVQADLLDDVRDVPHPRPLEPKLLLVEPAVPQRAEQVVQPLPLHDPVEHHLVAFGPLPGEPAGLLASRNPEGVSQLESPHGGRDAALGEFLLHVISVRLGSDLAAVEEQLDGE